MSAVDDPVPPARDALTRLAYKPARAAELLDCSRQTIYNLIGSGELRTVKIGKARRIPHTEVERLASTGGVTHAPA